MRYGGSGGATKNLTKNTLHRENAREGRAGSVRANKSPQQLKQQLHGTEEGNQLSTLENQTSPHNLNNIYAL